MIASQLLFNSQSNEKSVWYQMTIKLYSENEMKSENIIGTIRELEKSKYFLY